MKREIKCIKKGTGNEPYQRIQKVGGTWGSSTVEEAVKAIESKTYEYYVTVKGSSVKVKVATKNGHKYLITESDTTTTNNLLSLPNCPN